MQQYNYFVDYGVLETFVHNAGLIDLLEDVRRLELIHDTYEANIPQVNNGFGAGSRHYDRVRSAEVGEVQLRYSDELSKKPNEQVSHPRGRQPNESQHSETGDRSISENTGATRRKPVQKMEEKSWILE